MGRDGSGASSINNNSVQEGGTANPGLVREEQSEYYRSSAQTMGNSHGTSRISQEGLLGNMRVRDVDHSRKREHSTMGDVGGESPSKVFKGGSGELRSRVQMTPNVPQSSWLPDLNSNFESEELQKDNLRIDSEQAEKNDEIPNYELEQAEKDGEIPNFEPEPVEVNKKSRHINLYGEPSRVDKAHDKFWKFGKDNQHGGKKLNALDIMEKLCNQSDEKHNEDKIIWNTLEEKGESPKFDVNNGDHYPHMLANWACIHHVINAANEHGRFCRGDLEPTVAGQFSAGLTNKECTYRCTWCKFTYSFRPSPQLGNRGASDFFAGFAAQTCGGMKAPLERHYETLQMTCPTTNNFLNGSFKINVLRDITKKVADEVKEANLKRSLENNDGNVRLKIDMAHHQRM